jgi:hypothetical protein
MKKLFLGLALFLLANPVFAQYNTSRTYFNLNVNNDLTLGGELVMQPDEPIRWDIGGTGSNENYPQIRWTSSSNRWGLVTSATSPRTFFYLYGDATSGEPGQIYFVTYDVGNNFGLMGYDTDPTSVRSHQWYFRSSGSDALSVTNTGIRLPTGHVLQYLDAELTTASWDGVDSISLAADTPSGNTTLTLPALTGTLAVKIFSGSVAFNPGSTATDSCAAAITDTATGTLTTDVISWTFSADPTSTTGYDPSGDLGYIVAYPTADTVNFKFCNKSGNAIDPGSVTLNWRVDR